MLIHRFSSGLIVLIALWLTAALGCESSTRVAALSDEPLIRDDGRLISLDNSLEPLIERFNADRDKARVVAIVSSTCGACVRGAIAVNESVANAYPSADVSIFIVWIDILTMDDYAAAQRMAGIFNDPRVRQFHDPNALVGDAFARGLLDQPPAWDMYLLYAASPKQLWVNDPPKPTDWMHQIGFRAVDPARRRGGHDLVVGLYDAMSDLGFDPAIESPPSEQRIAAAVRTTNASVNSALREAALRDPSQATLTQCDDCAKAGFIGQCSIAGFRQIVAIPQQIGDDPAALSFLIAGTNTADSPMGSDPRLGPISGEVIVLDVEGMRCPDCPSKLAMSMLFLPGVKRVLVDFDMREARVTIDPPGSTNPDTLIAAVEQSGSLAMRRAALDRPTAAKSGGNGPYVVAFEDQSPFYARCLPDERGGSKGTTQIVRLRPKGDEVITTYSWYNRNGLVLGWSPKAGKVAVMRVRQDEGLPPEEQVEFSFYLGDQFLQSVTTADLVTLGANMRRDVAAFEGGLDVSAKHAEYRTEGCKQVRGTNDYYFMVRLDDTRTLSFDILTGRLCRIESDGRKQRLVLVERAATRN